MDKFYENLMSQNRKRPHDAITQNGDSNHNGKNENSSSTDTSPLSKRTLLNNHNSAHINKTIANGNKPVRMPQKSGKPTTKINLVNAPEEIYYVVNKQLK